MLEQQRYDRGESGFGCEHQRRALLQQRKTGTTAAQRVRRCDGNVGMQRAVYKKAQGHSRTPTEGRKYRVAFAIPLASMPAVLMATQHPVRPSPQSARLRAACELRVAF